MNNVLGNERQKTLMLNPDSQYWYWKLYWHIEKLNKILMNFVRGNGVILLVLHVKCSDLILMGHIEALPLIFWGIFTPFPITAIYSLLVVQEFHFLHTCQYSALVFLVITTLRAMRYLIVVLIYNLMMISEIDIT